MSKIRDDTKEIENKSIPNGLNGNSMIIVPKEVLERLAFKNKMASGDLSKDTSVDKDSLADGKDTLSSEVPTANGSLSSIMSNGNHDSRDSHSSNKSISNDNKSSQKSIKDEKIADKKDSSDKSNLRISLDKTSKSKSIEDKKRDVKNKDSSNKSNPKISLKKSSNSKSSDKTLYNKNVTSGKISNEISKTNTVLEKHLQKTKSSADSPSNVSEEKPLENGEVSSKETSRPNSPLSHELSDLEESLLREDDILANDEYCEEKLLDEIDEEALLKDKNTEDEDPLSSKSVSMSDVTKPISEVEDPLSSKSVSMSNVNKPIAEENEKSSDCDRQDKEIEKILKNLNSSIGNHGNSSSSSDKVNKGKVESSVCSNNSSEDKSTAKLSDNSPSLTETTSSLPGNSSTKTSGKRSYSSDKKSNSNSSSNKLLKINDRSRESANDVLKVVDKSKLESVEKKDAENSSAKSNKTAISFSEALKSIVMESKKSQLSMDNPQPLVPITEISSDVAPTSSNLTVLGAMDTRTQTVDSNVKSPSPGDLVVDIDTEKQGKLSSTVEGDENQGQKASSEGTEGQGGKKRPLSEGNDLALKPDLKKIRVFRNEEGKKKTDAEEISKTMELANTMVSRLQEDKAMQESNKAVTTDKSLEKEGLICIDQEDLERKTVNEMKKANLNNNKLKRIKRKDLEGLVIELFVDKVLYEHQLGQQKDLCKRLEATLECNRKKAAQFHKEIEDLKKVTQRLQAEHASRKGQVIAPVKVKRSVGIQATPTIISKGVMHASSYGNIRVLSPTPNSTSSSSFNSAGTITSVNRTIGGNQILQPGSVVASQPLAFASSQSGAGGQMVVVNPVVMQQTQNVGTGSPVVPVSSQTRVIRTPLTPISQPTLATSATQFTASPIPVVAPGSNSSSNSSSSAFIDLTDDDEAFKNQRTTLQPGSLVAIQRSPGNSQGSSQFVLNPPTSVGQLVLVPTTTGQATTALVVSSVANSTQSLPTGVVRSAALTQNTNVRFSASNIINTTRVVVGASQLNGTNFVAQIPHHPAPLPRAPPQQTSGYSKKLPPVPILKLSHKDNSIVLSWNMAKTDEHERVASYQLYAYQEGTAPPTPALWKKVGSVKALELPMACTLTQFMPGHVYHFAVRAVDIRSRLGPFSEPRSIRLGNN